MAVRIGAARAQLGDRFEIEREISHSGMATVFLATDRARDQRVALKILQPEFAVSIGGDRFRREIDILARLDHDNILALLEADAAGALLFYTTPYTSSDLRTRLVDDGPLPIDDAVEITRQVAEALDYAHGQNVLHRDIKPGNILLDGDRALVCDFGIARAIEMAGGESLSSSGLIVGTPTYMSPEQARHDKEIDGRADIYSLGCVLYEMLVGEPPFTGPTVQAVIQRHTKERPPKIRVVRPDVPEHVEAAVEAALAKRAGDRPASATTLAGQLACD